MVVGCKDGRLLEFGHVDDEVPGLGKRRRECGEEEKESDAVDLLPFLHCWISTFSTVENLDLDKSEMW